MTTTPDPVFTLTVTERELRLLWLAMGTLAEANPDDIEVGDLDARITTLIPDNALAGE